MFFSRFSCCSWNFDAGVGTFRDPIIFWWGCILGLLWGAWFLVVIGTSNGNGIGSPWYIHISIASLVASISVVGFLYVFVSSPPRNKHTEIHGNTYRKPQLIVVCQRGFQVEQAVLRFWLPVNTTSKNVDVFRTESCLTNHSWDVEPKMVGETAAASPAILTILARLTL